MNIAAGRLEPHVDEEQKEPWRLTIPDVKDVIVGEQDFARILLAKQMF